MARIVIFLQKRAAVEEVRRFSVARQVCFVKHKERLVEVAIHFELDDETERLAKKEEALLPDARLCHAPLQALYGLSYPFIHGRPSRQRKKPSDRLNRRLCGGAYWTRTSDPRDVNTVLYQLSQSTMDLCEPILAFCPPRHIHGALRIGSSVMYISQYVLPTEPCDQIFCPAK